MSPYRILVVEDEALTAFELQNILEDMGHEGVGVVHSGTKALEKVNRGDVDLILMDIRLQGEMDGVKAAEKIKQEVDLPVIFVTAHSDPETLNRAKESAPAGFLIKPITRDDLKQTIQAVMEG